MKTNAAHKIKVGDIFYNSWGYDQTNIDWYQVLEVKKKTILIKRIVGDYKEDGFMCGKTVPLKDTFSERNPESLLKTPYEYGSDSILRGDIYIHFEYGCGKLWDGSAKYESHYA